MAQLRDIQTSELLAEGPPEELVALAGELGDGEVLFDDVGAAFDPAAVKAALERDATGLEDAAKGERDPDQRVRLVEAAKSRRAALAPSKASVDRARKKLKQARDRLP